MKVVLYIGHHKVGSTALQAFLARNMLALLKQGILYPAVESQGLGHLLAQATGLHDSPHLGCMNLREPHNALAFRMLADKKSPPGQTPPWHGHLPQTPDMLATIRHQIEIFSPETVIICSEVLSNFGSGHDDLIAQLRDTFPGASFELYCTLRRPDEYLASWYGQRLRFGQKIAALGQGTALKDTTGIHFDYGRMLKPWVTAFTDSTLHLRSYDQVIAAGGSIEDFTQTISCNIPDGLSHQGPKNHGLHRAAFEVQRRANQDLSSNEAQKLLHFMLHDAPALPLASNDVELFGVALRRELFERFQPIDTYLGTLIGEESFFPDLDWMCRPRFTPLADASAKLLQQLEQTPLPSPEIEAFIQSLNKE